LYEEGASFPFAFAFGDHLAAVFFDDRLYDVQAESRSFGSVLIRPGPEKSLERSASGRQSEFPGLCLYYHRDPVIKAAGLRLHGYLRLVVAVFHSVIEQIEERRQQLFLIALDHKPGSAGEYLMALSGRLFRERVIAMASLKTESTSTASLPATTARSLIRPARRPARRC
jgi:hypothetical protein